MKGPLHQLWSFAAVLLGCAPTLTLPGEEGADAGASGLMLEPPGCCEVSPGFRFSFESPVAAPFPMMFRGELSDYHRARLDAEALPGTLVERRVVLGRESRGERTWFAPLDELVSGEPYSIAAGEDAVHVVEVGALDPGAFVRSWPRDAEATRLAVFCSPERARGASVTLPEGVLALVVPGTNHCVGLLAEPGLEPSFAPRELFGAPLQTTLLSGVASSRSEPALLDCDDDESRFVIGCARVEDDRLHFRTPTDAYWMVEGAATLGVAVKPGETATLSGLPNERRASLVVRVFLRDGTELEARLEVETARPRPHVVINEVFADPVGPEPQQEWIELYNDGTQALDLAGYRLGDRSFEEAAVLPSVVLAAGEYVVVVREDFDATLGWDPTPSASSQLLRVAELGSHGLSNSGEPLTLHAPSGFAVSRVPPLGARSGFSLARLTPSCPDTPECFAVHGDPGASPGAANTFDTER